MWSATAWTTPSPNWRSCPGELALGAPRQAQDKGVFPPPTPEFAQPQIMVKACVLVRILRDGVPQPVPPGITVPRSSLRGLQLKPKWVPGEMPWVLCCPWHRWGPGKGTGHSMGPSPRIDLPRHSLPISLVLQCCYVKTCGFRSPRGSSRQCQSVDRPWLVQCQRPQPPPPHFSPPNPGNFFLTGRSRGTRQEALPTPQAAGDLATPGVALVTRR